MDAIASNGWMIFRVVLGVGIAGLLLIGTKAGQAALSQMFGWLAAPSQVECKRTSDKMLADMDANVAAKQAATNERK